ncbi:MAG: hypothetical protein K9K62_03975 [Desulfobacteraceae bacterium]|nr:hypothetical protein [Desulfobacteraceae bacterium]
MKRLFQRLFQKGLSFRRKMDQYQESITFAEAGEMTLTAEAHEENRQPGDQPGVLLVIGNDDTFSRRIIDYAMEMALRMSYRIVALNMAPVPEAAFKLLSPPSDSIREFEQSARQNAASFAQAAEEAGISFEHIVKFGETDAVIDAVAREYGGVEFVVSEPAEDQVGDRAAKENRPENQVYVYTMV